MGKKSLLSILLLAFITGGFLIAGCGDDGPIGPVIPKTYSFYGLDLNGHTFYRFHPESGKLDTVANQLPDNSSPSPDVSANGRYFYLHFAESTGVYSADSMQFVRQLPYGSVEAVSSLDGRYIALLNSSRLGLRILRLPDYQLVYSDDTIYASRGVFSSDSRTFYCVAYATPRSEIFRLRLSPGAEAVRLTVPSLPGSLTQVVPSWDEKLWFLYSTWSSFGCSFGVYDVGKDSLRYLTSISPGHGWMAASPDGTHVFFTNPGTLLYPPQPPSSAFFDYNVGTNTVTEISTRGWADQPDTGDDFPIGPIALSPDGQTLVAVRSVDGRDLLVYDIPTRQFTRYCYFQRKAWLTNIVCQLRN